MTESLWDFACRCYARPGVAALCLDLQAQGANVCLLLTLLWLEHRQRQNEPGRYQRLKEQADDWQQFIEPLRALRMQWKTPAHRDDALQRLREQLKQLELSAERELLERLEVLTQHWPSATDGRWLEYALAAEQAQALRQAAC